MRHFLADIAFRRSWAALANGDAKRSRWWSAVEARLSGYPALSDNSQRRASGTASLPARDASRTSGAPPPAPARPAPLVNGRALAAVLLAIMVIGVAFIFGRLG